MSDDSSLAKLAEIEYRPLPVKDTLQKIKDLVSLMTDLGFYAYISKNTEIAKVVQRLEEEVEQLSYHLIMNAVLAARRSEDAEAASLIIKVEEALCYAANAAADIAQLSLTGIPSHRVVQEAFKSSEEIIESITITANSKLSGKRVSDLERMGIYVDVLALKKGGEWLISVLHNVNSVKLQPGDTIVVRGNDVALEKLKEVNEHAG